MDLDMDAEMETETGMLFALSVVIAPLDPDCSDYKSMDQVARVDRTEQFWPRKLLVLRAVC